MDIIRIAIVEDNKPRRELLQLLIDSTEGMMCVGAFVDGRDIVQHLKPLQPDIVLMDIDMPHVNGIEALKAVKAEIPQLKVLMQTVFDEEDQIFDAILAGADGYVLKKTPPAKLLDAIVDLSNGGSPMTPSVARQVLCVFRNKHERVKRPTFSLSPREEEVLGYLVQGLSYKMIADKCHLSYSTVNSHISHIYEKLHVESGPQAVAKAIEFNLGKRGS